MTSIIYYFSGTGNSYYIAKKTANFLGAQIRSITKESIDKGILSTEEQVGIVFPVYHQGLPNIIRDFVGSVTFENLKYLYAIVTYGNRPTLALKYLDVALKEKAHHLDNGFGIRMPYNYVIPTKIGRGFYKSFKFKRVNEGHNDSLLRNADSDIEVIGKLIKNQVKGPFAISDLVIESLVDFLHLRNSMQKTMWLKGMNYKGKMPDDFSGAIKFMDSAFQVNTLCTSCGLCNKICPVNNIRLVKGHPDFLHNCEQCFSCIAYCPSKAIKLINDTEGLAYHHPEVTATDLSS